MSESLVKIEPLSFATIEAGKHDEALRKDIPYDKSAMIASLITLLAFIPVGIITLPNYLLTFALSIGGIGILTFLTTLKLVKRKQKKVLADPIAQLHGKLRNSVLWFNNRVVEYNRYILECGMDDIMDTEPLKRLQGELLTIRRELKAKIKVLAPSQLPQAPCIVPLKLSMQRFRDHELSLPVDQRIKLLSQGELDRSMAEVERLLKE